MADIFEIMLWKGAVVGAGGLIAAGFATWSTSFLDRNRGTYHPPDVSPLPYFIGKLARQFALSTKRRALHYGVNLRNVAQKARRRQR